MKTIFRNAALGIFVAIMLFSADSYAQKNKVLDGMFIKETAPTRRVIPYTNIREADVMYYKRVWREIDIREKMNFPLYYPTEPLNEIGYVRMSLFDIIKNSIDAGEMTAYDQTSPGFQIELTKTESNDLLTRELITYDEDLETGAVNEVTVKEPIGGVDVAKYWIKEDWVFDRQRSVMEVRVIGIMPIINKIADDGSIAGQKGLFWIYFPEARYVLANQEVYNSGNDGARLTFDDYFMKRLFHGYIRQETNVYNNRPLDSYRDGVDRLLESRKIENEMANYEHDMWQF